MGPLPMTMHFCLRSEIQHTEKFATWVIGTKTDDFTRNMYYMNFAPECTLTTSDTMLEAVIEEKLTPLREMAELAKQSLTAATAAVKEAATAGAAAIAASSIATQEESAPPDTTRTPAETANEPMTTESDKILSPRKEAGALVRLGEAEKAAKVDYAEALRRLKKAREEYTGANTKISQKQTTIGKFLALNSKLIDRQSSKTNSPMKSERLDVVLSETGEATGLVGYAAFAEMRSLMAEGEVWNGGYDVAGKPVLIKIEIGWAYWGARHKYCPPLEHLTCRTQTEIKHNLSLTHNLMENSTPPITTCQSQTDHRPIQAPPNKTTHTNPGATTLQVLSGGIPNTGNQCWWKRITEPQPDHTV